MPGYYLHLAACKGNTLKNRSFVLGVEAPDLLKKHFKIYGNVAEARKKYETLKTADMPDYGELETRIQQKETVNSTTGLHYGVSSNPDIYACWNSLSETQKNNPFWRGYIWHLLTDKFIYSKLDIDAKFQKILDNNKNTINIDELQKAEVKKLHTDWDKTNSRVRDTYPEVCLPEEVKELGVVQFIERGDLFYIDWTVLKEAMEFLRKFNPLIGNMNYIIKTLLENA